MLIGEGAYTDGRPSGQSLLDGQGGPEPTSKTGAEHRHIFYRLYTKDGPLESNNPIYSNNCFISRISSKSVRPPHTAASLKRYLCKVEGFEGPENAVLYLSLSEYTALENSTRVSLRGNSGPGSSELDPVVLVVGTDSAQNRSKAAGKFEPEELLLWEAEERYVYYRLYDEDGEAVSKSAFDESDSSLGRITAYSIAPPHTVASLKRCFVKAEGVSDHDVQLLENEDSEITMNDDDAVALIVGNFPGIKEDQPMVFTYARKLSNETTAPQPSFSKRLTATTTWPGSAFDPKWHSLTQGEIFQTDGILRNEPYPNNNYPTGQLQSYTGINSSGKKAFILSFMATLS